jgi:hypothetical protein
MRPGGGQPVVDGVADEGVDEAVGGVGSIGLGDEAGADGGIEGPQ